MPKKIIAKFLSFIPSITWMGIIFYFSGRPTTGIGDNETQRFFILKSFHLIEYALLTILLFLGFRKYKNSILFAYLYAISDEYHQTFIPGRTGRIRDTFIDLLGIFLGAYIIKIFLKKFNSFFVHKNLIS